LREQEGSRAVAVVVDVTRRKARLGKPTTGRRTAEGHTRKASIGTEVPRDRRWSGTEKVQALGEPAAMKVARRVREGAVGEGLPQGGTSLAAYFIPSLDARRTWGRGTG